MTLEKNISKDLLEVGYQLNSSLDLQFILDKILEQKSLSLLSTKRAVIYLLDDNREFLIPQASVLKNFIKQTMQEPLPVKSSLSGKVINSKKGMIFNSTAKLPGAYQIPGTSDAKDENLMVLPLIAEDKAFGTINFYRDKIIYTENELETANIFSMYASVAIQNSIKNQQLLKEIEERNQIESELKINNERYRIAQNIGKVGNWEYNLQTQEFWGSDEAKRIYGFNLDTESFSSETVESCIPNRVEVHQALIDLIEKEKKYNLEFDIITYDKHVRKTITSVAHLEKDKDGNPLKVIGVIQDITKRKNYEMSLVESRRIIEEIINAVPVRIFWKDKDLNYLGCNKLFAEDAGYNYPSEIVGKNDFQMAWVEQAELYREDDFEIIKSGKPNLNIEESQTTPDGKTIELITNKVPLLNSNNEIIGVLGSYFDVTKLKEYEHEIVHKNERLELFARIFDNLNESIVVTNENDKIFYVNEAFKKMYGYKKEEYLDRTVDFLRANNDPKLVKEIRAGTKKGGWKGELYNMRKDGTQFPIEISTTPIYDKDKNIFAQIGIISDITERKIIEQQLLEEKEKYQALVENSTDAIFMVDSNANVSFVNSYAAKLLGKNVENIIGKNVNALFPKDVAVSQIEYIKNVYSTGKIARTESKIVFPGGKLWLDNILIPVINKNGEVINAIGVSRNITEKKKAEEELLKHKENLEELVKERTAELEEKNQLLDSSVKVFVGREQRIIDLERKIKDLEHKLKQG